MRRIHIVLVDIIGAKEVYVTFLVLKVQLTMSAMRVKTVKPVLILFAVEFQVYNQIHTVKMHFHK